MNNDCLLHIFSYLNLKEIGCITVVCKQYNSVSSDNMVWEPLFVDSFKQMVVRDICKSKYKQFDSLDKFLGKTIHMKLINSYNSQRLYLYHNHLSSLPTEIGLLVNLQKLYLNDNQLSSLPAEIGLLVNLRTLYLHNNQLSSLSSKICLLVNLQKLSLSYNQLNSLPSEIGLLVNLRKFYLHNNQLSSLPIEIGLLVNLQRLYIDQSDISLIPDNLKHTIIKV